MSIPRKESSKQLVYYHFQSQGTNKALALESPNLASSQVADLLH
jgi:hypothetical protein